jgi:hypothetical protein
MNFDLDKDFADFDNIVGDVNSDNSEIKRFADSGGGSLPEPYHEEELKSLMRAWELFQGNFPPLVQYY